MPKSEFENKRWRDYLKRRDTPGTVEHERHLMWSTAYKDYERDEIVNVGTYRPHLGIFIGEVLLQGKHFISPQLRKKEIE